MEVLSSPVLLRPADLGRSRHFYRDVLGLAIYWEFRTSADPGMVFFLGPGFREVSGQPVGAARHSVMIWLQVRDINAEHERLAAASVHILRETVTEPWALTEMWIEDPDGVWMVLASCRQGVSAAADQDVCCDQAARTRYAPDHAVRELVSAGQGRAQQPSPESLLLQRRVSESTERLGKVPTLTLPEDTGLVGKGRRGGRPLAPDLDPGFKKRLVYSGGDAQLGDLPVPGGVDLALAIAQGQARALG